jgi:deoxyribonuclease V
MNFTLPSWPTNATDAIALQKELRHRLRIENDFGKLKTIAGVDVSYDIKNNTSRAVIVTVTLSNLMPLETVITDAPTTFPYIPGLLSFREIPVILQSLEKLKAKPDLLMVDGQGIAHPRRLGIAAHLGVLTDIPSIGVAKSRLTGTYREPGHERGDQSPLMDKNERIGTVLRSKPRTNVLFISPGHRIDHETAVEITLQCLTRYRLPEPTRIADKISKQRENQGRLLI